MNRRFFAAIGAGLLGLPTLPRSWADSPGTVSASSLIRPGDPVLGNPRGTVTIVEFYDLRCPPCREMHPRFWRLLRDNHDVRYVPVDYPLLGAPSLLGAEALFAAQEQGQYAQLQARLMTEAAPTPATLKTDAQALGLDWDAMEFAMSGDRIARRIAANMARGRRLDIRVTPVIFIGDVRITGALSYAALLAAVAGDEAGTSRA